MRHELYTIRRERDDVIGAYMYIYDFTNTNISESTAHTANNILAATLFQKHHAEEIVAILNVSRTTNLWTMEPYCKYIYTDHAQSNIPKYLYIPDPIEFSTLSGDIDLRHMLRPHKTQILCFGIDPSSTIYCVDTNTLINSGYELTEHVDNAYGSGPYYTINDTMRDDFYKNIPTYKTGRLLGRICSGCSLRNTTDDDLCHTCNFGSNISTSDKYKIPNMLYMKLPTPTCVGYFKHDLLMYPSTQSLFVCCDEISTDDTIYKIRTKQLLDDGIIVTETSMNGNTAYEITDDVMCDKFVKNISKYIHKHMKLRAGDPSNGMAFLTW